MGLDNPPIIHDVVQGSDEWHELRRGMLTASTIGQLITPKTIKVADNMASRALTAELVAERITGYVTPEYVSYAMAEGHMIEPVVRELYAKTRKTPVFEVGFITRDVAGHRAGFSPDGLVGDDGFIEIKNVEPKGHVAIVLSDQVPAEHLAQIYMGMIVSGRQWCDFVPYCGGLPLWTKRVIGLDERWFDAIHEAVSGFEANAAQMIADYTKAVDGLPATERIEYYTEVRF